jgi:hypothetical protein
MGLFLAKGWHPVREGLRLGFLNLMYIIVSAGCFLFLMFGIRSLLRPFSAQVMLFLPVVACGYFLMWARFVTSYASQRSHRKKLYSLLVSFIGIVPNLLFLIVIRMAAASPLQESCGEIVWMLAYFIFLLSAIVMPLWGLLASLLTGPRKADNR